MIVPALCLAEAYRRTDGFAQAAIEAASRPIVPIMTDQPALVGRCLPEEWPVIAVETQVPRRSDEMPDK